MVARHRGFATSFAGRPSLFFISFDRGNVEHVEALELAQGTRSVPLPEKRQGFVVGRCIANSEYIRQERDSRIDTRDRHERKKRAGS